MHIAIQLLIKHQFTYMAPFFNDILQHPVTIEMTPMREFRFLAYGVTFSTLS